MKQELSTAIDFYLQTQKTNPFIIHLSSNSSSHELITLRNCAYILNKLTLLNLQHPTQNGGHGSFQKEVLELYDVNIDAIINNSLMPYRDFDSVKDLVSRIQHYHFLLSKLTFIATGEDSDVLRRKVSLNSFWPRIRAWLIAIQDKIPQNYSEIRQYVMIRRGLLETDKKYFLSQMMAKKIQTKNLKDLITRYQRQLQNHGQKQHQIHEKVQTYNDENSTEAQTWLQVKGYVRMIPLTNQLSDWVKLYQFLFSQRFKQKQESQKKQIFEYIKDVLGSLLIGPEEFQLYNENIAYSSNEQIKQKEKNEEFKKMKEQIKRVISNHDL